MISKNTIEKVFEISRVEEVIGEFIQLKKSGSNYKGLSPFTNEKTPSFMISPAKQIWKDFSSGKGGNVVAFLMEHEQLSYPQAIKFLAKKYNIDRKEQQEFAISSHEKASNADSMGNFKDEITSIKNDTIDVTKDGGIRPGTTQEILDGLKLAFDQNGTVTAGTSSPLTDGAAATLICEENYAKENNLKILGRIVSTAVEGCKPDYMGLGPIGASKKALQRANLTIDKIDIVEINEAFASQSIACVKDLGIDLKKVNLDGGALALGHPLGATGSRITGKASELLIRENKKYALSTQCIGLGMGIATIIETVQ